MSLRSQHYEPAMALRAETSLEGSLTSARVNIHNAGVFAGTAQFHVVEGFNNDDMGEVGNGIGSLNALPQLIEAVEGFLGTLTGEAGTELARVVFMRELEDKTMDLVNPPQRTAADIFGPGKKAGPIYPPSWPSHLVKAAKEKRRVPGMRLTGGPFG